MPPYAPNLNRVEGIWSLSNHGGLANLAAESLDRPVHVTKQGLKKIQCQPYLVDGLLAMNRHGPQAVVTSRIKGRFQPRRYTVRAAYAQTETAHVVIVQLVQQV